MFSFNKHALSIILLLSVSNVIKADQPADASSNSPEVIMTREVFKSEAYEMSDYYRDQAEQMVSMIDHWREVPSYADKLKTDEGVQRYLYPKAYELYKKMKAEPREDINYEEYKDVMSNPFSKN